MTAKIRNSLNLSFLHTHIKIYIKIKLTLFLSIHLFFITFANSNVFFFPALFRQTEAERRIWCETAGLNIFLFFQQVPTSHPGKNGHLHSRIFSALAFVSHFYSGDGNEFDSFLVFSIIYADVFQTSFHCSRAGINCVRLQNLDNTRQRSVGNFSLKLFLFFLSFLYLQWMHLLISIVAFNVLISFVLMFFLQILF